MLVLNESERGVWLLVYLLTFRFDAAVAMHTRRVNSALSNPRKSQRVERPRLTLKKYIKIYIYIYTIYIYA